MRWAAGSPRSSDLGLLSPQRPLGMSAHCQATCLPDYCHSRPHGRDPALPHLGRLASVSPAGSALTSTSCWLASALWPIHILKKIFN